MANKNYELTNTGIVIEKGKKILITYKPEKTFISNKEKKEIYKSAKERMNASNDSKDGSDEDDEKHKDELKAKTLALKQEQKSKRLLIPRCKTKKAIFAFSIIGLIFVTMFCIFYPIAVMISEKQTYSGNNFAEIIITCMIPAAAVITSILFIMFLVVSGSQLRIQKGIKNRIASISNFVISAMLLLISGLILYFYIMALSDSSVRFFALKIWSFRQATIMGITLFIFAYLIAYTKVYGNGVTINKSYLNLYQYHIKGTIKVAGFFILCVAIIYSMFGFSGNQYMHVASFYFGPTLVSLLMSTSIAMAINVILIVAFNRKNKNFLVDIIIGSAMFLIILILSIVAATKFTTKQTPVAITTGISACMLVASLLSFANSIYLIINKKKYIGELYLLPDVSKPIEYIKVKKNKKNDEKKTKEE